MSRQEKDISSLYTFEDYKNSLYTINEDNFEAVALSLFRLQARKNSVYNQYINLLGICPDKIERIEHIPFLPISFFKNKEIVSGHWVEDTTFLSSGTTGLTPGRHKIQDISFYRILTGKIFSSFYGSLNKYHFLALLPSYSESKNSSLAAMIEHFIERSQSDYSGFYLNHHDALCKALNVLKGDTKKAILWGVSSALMELAKSRKLDLEHCIVMETGGMKGKRAEMVRAQFHKFLCHRFNLEKIHSEYGMAELLSQAYSYGKGHFRTPAWMKIVIRDIRDPFSFVKVGKSGGINVIDLANIHTCAFIETQDIGKICQNGDFEVLGRLDYSDARGCNLLV